MKVLQMLNNLSSTIFYLNHYFKIIQIDTVNYINIEKI